MKHSVEPVTRAAWLVIVADEMLVEGEGRVRAFITVGGKSSYDNLHKLDTPYGKIHRVAAVRPGELVERV